MLRNTLLLTVSLGLALATSLHADDTVQSVGIDFFEKKIRPVLVEQCYRCHSTERRQRGGLAVDTKEALAKGGDTGPAVVTGKPGKSLLIKALHYTDIDLQMPPRGKLPARVIADFEKWVAMGAPDPRSSKEKVATYGIDLEEGRKFWSFQPPKQHPLPEVSDEAWASTPIDRFILAKLEEKRLQPAEDADRVTLLRRVYFALIGLPPTPKEIDAFLADKSPNAYAKVVDRLLESPRFGERWGRHWLDIARYSDSTGGGRSLLFKNSWRYRDYVIDAFNSDKPYNRFILEQLAGDLLPHANDEERQEFLVALAFLVIGPHNYELQDKPVLEMDVIDEQLDTMGRAFLGMTIGCARCHDHKFDPIPTRDYYAMATIFRNTQTLVHSNVSTWVRRPLPMPPAVEARVEKHRKAVAALRSEINELRTKLPGKSKSAGSPIALNQLAGIVVDDMQAIKKGKWTSSTYSNYFVHKGYVYSSQSGKNVYVAFQPELQKAGVYEVRLSYIPHPNRATKVRVDVSHADGVKTHYINQQETPPIGDRFLKLGKFRFEAGPEQGVKILTEGARGTVIADAVQFLPDGTEAKFAAREKKGPEDQVDVRKVRRHIKKLEARLKKLQRNVPSRPMAMGVKEDSKIEPGFICIRGNVHNKGATVEPGFLQVATVGEPPKIPDDQSGRRQLAEWIANRDNPLTARVMVNRIWHHLFGTGIVRTVDNFGRTGERPSHPKLLDHLALEFMQDNWSIKKMIRRIVLSHTYRLSSNRSDKAQAVDPENRLLAAMNRRRLEAESLRDAMLSVSGQLDLTMGGYSIRKGTSGERGYRFTETRRSVYMPVFRNELMEIFEVFDFADPNLALGRRATSTVSTQALYLLNSPFVMDQARHAAKSVLNKDLTDAQRVEYIYKKTVGRPPTPTEKRLALQYVGRIAKDASDKERLAVWEELYQVLFACIDFRYVN